MEARRKRLLLERAAKLVENIDESVMALVHLKEAFRLMIAVWEEDSEEPQAVVMPGVQVHADFTPKIDAFLNAEGARHIDRIVEGVQWMFDRHVRGGKLVCVLFALIKLDYVVDARHNYMPGFVMLLNYALAERKEKMMKTGHNRTLFDPLYLCFRFHPFHLFTNQEAMRAELEQDRMLPSKKVEEALRNYEADAKNMNDFLEHMGRVA